MRGWLDNLTGIILMVLACNCFLVDDFHHILTHFVRLENFDKILQWNLHIFQRSIVLTFLGRIQGLNDLFSKIMIRWETHPNKWLDDFMGFKQTWTIVVPWNKEILRKLNVFAVWDLCNIDKISPFLNPSLLILTFKESLSWLAVENSFFCFKLFKFLFLYLFKQLFFSELNFIGTKSRRLRRFQLAAPVAVQFSILHHWCDLFPIVSLAETHPVLV